MVPRGPDQVISEAQFNLGCAYYAGEGVPQDYAEGAMRFRKAADQGQALAQFNLGIMYYNGQCVSQDYIRAHIWFNLSASLQTDPESRVDAVENRDRNGLRASGGRRNEFLLRTGLRWAQQ